MPTPIKYTGPCETHLVFTRACKHCTAWAARMRRSGGPQIPRAKRKGTTGIRFTKRISTWRGHPVLRLSPLGKAIYEGRYIATAGNA